MSKSFSRLGAVLLAAAATLLLVVGPSAAAVDGGTARADKITVWTDKDRKTAVERVVGQWAAGKGLGVTVVEKDFGKIRDDLKTVQPESAPDVIIGAHDWTGQLAADGLVVPLFPSRATRAQFPDYALSAFSYGTAVKRLYGAPVVLENIGLVVNTKLAKVPTTWASLESQALAFKKKKPATSRSPSRRARPATPITCTRSSPASGATSSATTRPATSTPPTSASRTRRS